MKSRCLWAAALCVPFLLSGLTVQARIVLNKSIKRPVRIVEIVADSTAFQGFKAIESHKSLDSLALTPIADGKSIILDFGEHLVGTVTMTLGHPYLMQDAIQRFDVSFGEIPSDLALEREPFTGSLSRGWLQDYTATVDYSGRYTFPNRIAGRYMKITPVGPSPYCLTTLGDVSWEATTSAGESHFIPDSGLAPIFKEIARVSENTLRSCMQTVYEDGPKRDRRLWGGDFYLQALANTVTFKNHELTLRCLDLLAECADSVSGLLNSNLVDTPTVQFQANNKFEDYAMAYLLTLADYYDATGDSVAVGRLWPTAIRQVNASLGDEKWGTVFFDWCPVELDREAAFWGYRMYVMRRAVELAGKTGHYADVRDYPKLLRKMRAQGRQRYWDKREDKVVSGPGHQVSRTGTSWAVLGGLLDKEESRRALRYALDGEDVVKCGTPFANHFLVQALIESDMGKEARDFVEDFWGGMVRYGADTFWEFYVPDDHFFSSYNGYTLLNSYCHAWSCTPVYFIARYPEIFRAAE